MNDVYEKISKCRCCGKMTLTPKYLYIYEVWFHYFISKLRIHKGFFCEKCASKLSITCLFKSIIFGTFTLPFGIIYVLMAVFYNMFLGKVDRKQTYRCLFDNTEKLFLNKEYENAFIVYNRAKRYAKTNLQKHNLEILGSMIRAEVGAKKVKTHWNIFDKSSFWLGLIIGGLFLALISNIGVFIYGYKKAQIKDMQHKIESKKSNNYEDFGIVEIPYLENAQNLKFKIKHPKTILYNGPSYDFDIIGEMKENEEVFITAIVPNSNWVKVKGKYVEGFLIKHYISQ